MTAVLQVFVTSTGLKIRITIKSRSSCGGRKDWPVVLQTVETVSLCQIRLRSDEILSAKLSAVSLRGNLGIICHLECESFYSWALFQFCRIQFLSRRDRRRSNKTVSGSTLGMSHVPPGHHPPPTTHQLHCPTGPPWSDQFYASPCSPAVMFSVQL